MKFKSIIPNEIKLETKRKKSVSFDNEVKVVEAAPVLELDEVMFSTGKKQ